MAIPRQVALRKEAEEALINGPAPRLTHWRAEQRGARIRHDMQRAFAPA